MPYYKSNSGVVYFYESEVERDAYGSSDLVEMNQDQIDKHLNPPKTYQQELAELNASWQKQVDSYNRSFAVAALADGPSEEATKLSIRNDYEAARIKNAADRSELKAKHGM